jgi:single-strand DNA-binding protein
MNVVTLIGNLATDVEVRDVGEGGKRASFLLAVDRRSAACGADFVSVVVWDKLAETCERFLVKGRRIGVIGRLRSHSWEEEGRRHRRVEVVADAVEFLSPPDAAAGTDTPFAAAAALTEEAVA